MSNLEYIWEKSIQAFPILDNILTETACNSSEIIDVVSEIKRHGLVDDVYRIIFSNIDCILRHQIVPKFWSFFNNIFDWESGFYQFQLAVYELYNEYQKFNRIFNDLTPLIEHVNGVSVTDCYAEFRELLKVDLLSQLPHHFNAAVYGFYFTSFEVFANSQSNTAADEEAMDDDEIKCSGCGKESDKCRCQELLHAFNKTNQYLADMNLLDRLAGNTLTHLIQHRIKHHVQETCKGVFDRSHFGVLEDWLEAKVLKWLYRIYNQGTYKTDVNQQKIDELLNNFKVKLQLYLYETYAKVIISQFFHVIIDFPDSLPAIQDLRHIFETYDLKAHMVRSVKSSLEKKLLHPGVNTIDILTGYVAAIKTIRALDSSGLLLDAITDPIKKYMRNRSDTVRCVATALTDDGPTDLSDELAASEAYVEDTSGNNDQLNNWETWVPEPIDANISIPCTTSRSADIISMVIDIYGSKEVFVNEYRTLLADRLLTQLDFNPEREIRNLELLKLRFGESILHTCEVMLKDISDSKRINAHIAHENEAQLGETHTFDVKSLILSNQFWPSFKNDTLQLPEDLKAEFDRFTKSYETYKGNRTLAWRPFIGRVELEIEFGNKTINMNVSPVHAVILHEFQKQKSWHLEDLSQHVKVLPSVLRKRVWFWISKGFIEATATDYFTLIDEPKDSHGPSKQIAHEECDDDENESAMTSTSDQREEELQVFWSYIVGMLTNLDSLPLERIHQMLKMFASDGIGIEFSQEELKQFLQRKVRERALVFAGGVYQLPK